MRTPALALIIVIATASALPADDAKTADAKLKDYLSGIKGADAARVTPLTTADVKAAFPDHDLFGVLFPQFPVARIAPEPLKSANVVAIPKKDGRPVLITDLKELEAFARAHAKTATHRDQVALSTAWVRLAVELHQDGFFEFVYSEEPKLAVPMDGDDDSNTGYASVSVKPQNGDKGQITAQLMFKGGKLVKVETKVGLKAGMRPRCQATKLLDPDPLVRLMAEDALRVMGSTANDYLAEQYAKASPELREAIDRVRAKIKAEGR